jgi:hypothetical protein
MKRPGVISLIGWIILLQAFFGAVAGVTTIALRNTDAVIEATGATDSGLLFAGVWMLIVAVVLGLIGLGILGGSRVARGIVAAVEIIHVAGAAWLMFTHHEGGFLYQGLIAMGVAVFVLWALFSEKADEFYEAT